ncbi:MAG: erythromycin esterase family protein [Vicinamibacterales bacterium]
MPNPPFADRADAGRRLAEHLAEYSGRTDVVILALPRGGVPVGFEVASRLHAPLDVFLVRKLGVPTHPELAMGAIAEGGVQVLDQRLIRDLGISQRQIDQAVTDEGLELERRSRLYRGSRPRPQVSGRIVIVVDDGLATGATMEAAVVALKQLKPAAIVIAAPVGAPETCERLRRHADRVVCAETPKNLRAVGMWYDDFSQTTDAEVHDLMGRAASSPQIPRQHPASDAAALVRAHAQRLKGALGEYDQLIAALGDHRVVLIGEATHGTHEFYRERAVITKRLIAEQGFSAVAVEADWPDAYRVNRYVQGAGPDEEAVDALADFRRFPSWMWRNADVLDFTGWLRARNEALPDANKTGFYGLDLYSLHTSMRAVIAFLQKVDPAAALRAQARYACFDRYGDEMNAYAHSTGLGITPSCEREVVTQLVELRRQAAEYARRDGRLAQDEYFVAEQNARVVKDAEAYYRTMLQGRVESWNLRDHHMMDTLESLMKYLGRSGRPSRVVVWAHNSHLGDARATEMGDQGELNIGQLARERFGDAVVSVGFSTYTGTVTAATEWGGPAHRRHVRPALPGSYEHLFHEVGIPRFLLSTKADPQLAEALARPRLQRAIGVLYMPATERRSHYFQARLSDQFDYVQHIDQTRAVEPLERTSEWDVGELAETFPSGL